MLEQPDDFLQFRLGSDLIPNVPKDGYYNVYVSWDSDSGNDPNALPNHP